MSFNNFLADYYANKVDFRYNARTKTYGVVRFNADPELVLCKDGVARRVPQEEVQRQLAELLAD